MIKRLLLVAGLVLAVLIAAAIVAGHKANGDVITGHAQPVSCDVKAVAGQALDDLGEHHVTLIVDGMIDGGAYGYQDGETIHLWAGAQCRYVTSTLWHEWAHVQQWRANPDEDYVANVRHIERVADCVARLSGAEDYSPYLSDGPCTEQEQAEAVALYEAPRQR